MAHHSIILYSTLIPVAPAIASQISSAVQLRSLFNNRAGQPCCVVDGTPLCYLCIHLLLLFRSPCLARELLPQRTTVTAACLPTKNVHVTLAALRAALHILDFTLPSHCNHHCSSPGRGGICWRHPPCRSGPSQLVPVAMMQLPLRSSELCCIGFCRSLRPVLLSLRCINGHGCSSTPAGPASHVAGLRARTAARIAIRPAQAHAGLVAGAAAAGARLAAARGALVIFRPVRRFCAPLSPQEQPGAYRQRTRGHNLRDDGDGICCAAGQQWVTSKRAWSADALGTRAKARPLRRQNSSRKRTMVLAATARRAGGRGT